MPRLLFIAPDGAAEKIEVPAGTSLMVAAVTHGIDGIEGQCGGSMACGTCHMRIPDPPAPLPPLSSAEEAMLSAIEGPRWPDSRLGCQIRMTDQLDGLHVVIPMPSPE